MGGGQVACGKLFMKQQNQQFTLSTTVNSSRSERQVRIRKAGEGRGGGVRGEVTAWSVWDGAADSDSPTSACQAKLQKKKVFLGWNCGEGRVQRAEMDQNDTTSRFELCMCCDLVHVNGLWIFYSTQVDRVAKKKLSFPPATNKKQTKTVKVDKRCIGGGKSLERRHVLLNGSARVVCLCVCVGEVVEERSAVLPVQ